MPVESRALPVHASRQNTLLPSAWATVLQSISPELSSVLASHWLKIPQRAAQAEGSWWLFACMHAHPACTHPCAFSLPFALACMTGKMSYKQIQIETQKRANYNMFNYLFQNHSSSLLYSMPGNVFFVIWHGHFFSSLVLSPLLGGKVVTEWERREKSCSRAQHFRLLVEIQKTNAFLVSVQQPEQGVLSLTIVNVFPCCMQILQRQTLIPSPPVSCQAEVA